MKRAIFAIGASLIIQLLTFSYILQAEEASYFWQKAMSRGPLELYQVELTGKGTGTFQFQKRGQESIETHFSLSPRVIERLHSLFQRADFFNPAKEFVSPRKLADMGMKTLRMEEGAQRREITFNYSEERTLWPIVDFFENLSQQERDLFDLELALKYDKLGIPQRLESLDKALEKNQIIAPERFAPLLEKIYYDQSMMNMARSEAKRLLGSIEKKKL
jgi:hypothetical protein